MLPYAPSAAATIQQDYQQYYEKLRQTLNTLAEQNQLGDEINSYLVEIKEACRFNHEPYVEHLIVNGVETGGKIAGGCAGLILGDLNLVHTSIDYYNAYQVHQSNNALAAAGVRVSEKLVKCVELLGQPHNYTEALAHQALLSKINPFFCDPQHKEKFIALREEANAAVNKYAQLANVNRLETIEHLNQQQVQMQLLTVESISALRAQNVKLVNAASAIQTNMAEKTDIAVLQQRLNEQGIETNQNFLELLTVSEVTRQNVMQLVVYLEEQRQQKAAEIKQQQTEANYQGLNSACQFVGQVAALSGAKDLARVAGVVQAGVQIYRAANQVMAIGSMGLAMLNPVSAIGMAALSAISLFRSAPDPNKILMRQLTQISHQISYIHKDLLQGQQGTNQRLIYLLEITRDGFANLHQSQTIPVARKLDDIQDEITTVIKLVNSGFKEVLLSGLRIPLAYVEDLAAGKIAKSQVSNQIYIQYLLELNNYIFPTLMTQQRFNGLSCYQDARSDGSNSQHLIKLFVGDRSNKYRNLMGVLAHYAIYDLAVNALSDVDPSMLMQPELWNIALGAYVQLKRMFLDQYVYDAAGENNKNYEAQAKKFLKFIDVLRSDKKLYESIFQKIKFFIGDIQSAFLVSNSKTIEQEYATLLQSPHVQTVTGLQCKTEGGESISGNFLAEYQKQLTAYTQESKFIKKLQQFGYNIPHEFLLAVTLGLGNFECILKMPIKERSHHKHRPKLMATKQAGLEMRFICQGEHITLFQASTVDKNLAKKVTKRNMDFSRIFDFVLEKLKQPAVSIEICTQMQERIKQHLLNKKKLEVRNVVNTLSTNKHYHELLKINHFLFAYITCAGFPKAIQERCAAVLLLQDIRHSFEAYANSAGYTTPVPSVSLNFESYATLSTAIYQVIDAANANPDLFSQQFSHEVCQHVVVKLQELRELMIIENLVAENKKNTSAAKAVDVRQATDTNAVKSETSWEEVYEKANSHYANAKTHLLLQKFSEANTFFQRAKDHYKQVIQTSTVADYEKGVADKRLKKINDPDGKHSPSKLLKP